MENVKKSVLDQFNMIRKADDHFVRRSPTKWKYQEIRNSYDYRYKTDVVNDFNTYDGPNEIIKWFNWLKEQKSVSFFPQEELKPFIDKIVSLDMDLLRRYNLEYSENEYRENVAINTAMDYVFQNSYTMPSRCSVSNVLDFGAGFGRQANLWTQLHEDIIFVGVDAIPKSYCLQNFYYSNLHKPFFEYLEDPETFEITNSKRGIYHLPTWRLDLLPDNFFDLIICTQVLNELDKKSVKRLIKVFNRILKPSGKLYIRDHEDHIMTDKRNMNKILTSNSYTLEFRPYLIDNEDAHGTVRIWRKLDRNVEDKNNVFKKRSILMKILYTKLGLVLYKFFKYLKYKKILK
jgi:SAM-dependent methyltransferase